MLMFRCLGDGPYRDVQPMRAATAQERSGLAAAKDRGSYSVGVAAINWMLDLQLPGRRGLLSPL